MTTKDKFEYLFYICKEFNVDINHGKFLIEALNGDWYRTFKQKQRLEKLLKINMINDRIE
jgi:hypothetical protein